MLFFLLYDHCADSVLGECLKNDGMRDSAIYYVGSVDASQYRIETSGAKYARMTGSGSAVFAMYENKEARDKAYEQMKSDPEFSDCDIFPSKTI